jgi:integrase/recombinase XerD
MPRDPFLTAARCYLDDLRPYWQPLTVEQRRRDLKVIAHDLWTLRKESKIANVRPSVLNEDDIGALLLYWRTRPSRGGPNLGKPMDASTQAHLFGVLRKFLRWCGNPVIARIEARGHGRFPKAIEKPIDVLSMEQLEQLRKTANAFEGWAGSVASFLVAFCPATGLRPKEIRLARLKDLDVSRWRILVAHPKGEGSWAAPDYAPVLPMGRQVALDFLTEREAYLKAETCDALIPYHRVGGEVGPWSGAMLRKLKGEIEEKSGIRFHLKTFRATFAQTAKDAGVSIEAVGRAMRHKTTKTTERFYARIRADDAFREFDLAFESDVIAVRQKR